MHFWIIGILTVLFFPNEKSEFFIQNTNNQFQNTQEMSSQNELLIKYTAYNVWANEQIANWLMDIPESMFSQEVESSFNSLSKTIAHLWNAEAGWLKHIKDEIWESPAKDFTGTGKEMLENWLQTSRNFHEYLKIMPLEKFTSSKPNSRGDGSTLYADMIHHCMNHSTYHRGQLITMGRQLGLETPPRTDFIYYVNIAN
jgi:uncharacterized damage-inducible protein DinB